MNDVRDPLAWRRFADMDIEAARVLKTHEHFEVLSHVVAFHAHQSAEKYLKGLLVLRERGEPPRIHNLRLLLTHVAEYVRELETPELENATNGLDQFYVPSRYPAEVGGPAGPITAEEATEALAWAEEIAAAVRPRLED
jgi:HEPN domain-containing protein